MKVKTIMTRELAVCRPHDSVFSAAQLLWESDCGALPVINGTGAVRGILTDRDLCMAALLSNRPLSRMQVGDVMATDVQVCHADDSLRDVHATMRDHQIRRIPVVDEDEALVGIVSLNDLAIEAFETRSAAATRRQKDAAKTLAAIAQPRGLEEEEEADS